MNSRLDEFRLLPDSASDVSHKVDVLWWVLTSMSGVFTLLVFVLIVWFAIRYRRRHDDEVPTATQSHWLMETVWCAALFVVFLVIFFWSTALYVGMKRPIRHALEIHVIGKQWMWKIQHPGGQREINELHVPVGESVKLIMTSQDVIHSFGLPAFRITQDVLPGSYSTQWFKATRTGEFRIFCREYCGMMHSAMVGRVIVMPPQDYEAWLAGRVPDESPPVSGARLFASYGCAQCHGRTAPTLAGLFGRRVQLEDGSIVEVDDQYLRNSILNPPSQVVAGFSRLMPSYRDQLSEEQLIGLIAYIKSLGAAQTEQPAPARTDVAAPPATSPTGFPLESLPNMPPARQPPGVQPPVEPAEGARPR